MSYPPLTENQKESIDYFQNNPPKYYAWFYKFYTRWIGNVIFFGILTMGALMLIFQDSIFNVLKGMFFVLFGLVIWAGGSFIYKHLYTKKYAKKVGMTMKQWNFWTKGMELNV